MTTTDRIKPDFKRSARFITAVRERIGRVVVGQEVVVERLLISLLTGGHILLQGVPGTAKTLLASALSKGLDLEFARVQFTIDLLPSDILGSEILDQSKNEFKTMRGPIFTNLLLADEINRAAPKVQSALLEAMQERKVTIGNHSHVLPAPFLVIATQNPVEQSGTFELPEAQLDRFMLLHRLGYPTPEEERTVLRRNIELRVERRDGGAVVQTEFDIIDDSPVSSGEELIEVMEAVQTIFVSDTFVQHTVELVNRTRSHPDLELGCSPRAGIALVKASRARALIHGRDYVVPEDLFQLAEDVVLHRIRLKYEALAEGRTGKGVLEEILRAMGSIPPVPDGSDANTSMGSAADSANNGQVTSDATSNGS
ncbi:MAG: MoxR-like ATPase [Planctomycetota bacterium]|jgi:MoxR-like ATPase